MKFITNTKPSIKFTFIVTPTYSVVELYQIFVVFYRFKKILQTVYLVILINYSVNLDQNDLKLIYKNKMSCYAALSCLLKKK
jgi:hypothetical protein